MKKRYYFLALVTMVISACTPSPTATALPSNTATETATATKQPTDTPTATPNYLATEAAEATEAADAVLAEIILELSDLGLSTVGQLAFAQAEPIEIAITEQNFDGIVQEIGFDSEFRDFAMGVDITWETETGLSGCGIVFRSERDIEAGEQMRVHFSRLSGAPLWMIGSYNYGHGQAFIAGDGNTAMKSQQGSSNHFVLVANGLSVTIYANGTRMGAGTLPAALVEGRFGFLAWEDSGETICTFENAWILEYPVAT